MKTPDIPLNYHQKNSKRINTQSNFNEENIRHNQLIRIVKSRQIENQKPFGYSTENHFKNQKYFFNSNFKTNNPGEGKFICSNNLFKHCFYLIF